MERTIGVFQVPRQFEKVLSDIQARGDRYVVKRHGEPVAVVVSIAVYQQWKQSREAFCDQMEEVGRRSDLSAKDADALVDSEVDASRAAHRQSV